MSSRTTTSPRYTGSARVDVTDCAAARVKQRIDANAVSGAEVYLERRGGRTYLVTEQSATSSDGSSTATGQ